MEHAFLDVVGMAVNEARSQQMADSRFGYMNALKPKFPDACKINYNGSTFPDSPACAYLFAQRGATIGPYLPIVPTNDCIVLDDGNTYTSRGHDIKNFQRENKGKNEVVIESMRLQGNVAVEFFDNNSCTPTRSGVLATFDTVNEVFNFTDSPIPNQIWRFSATKAKGNNLADFFIRSFEDPEYGEKMPACLCPDTNGFYPPLEDVYFTEVWNKLETFGYINSTMYSKTSAAGQVLNDMQKVAVIKYLMNFDVYEEDRLLALEQILGKAFWANKAAGNTAVMADIKRQIYDVIFVDGPINLEMPFPFACSGRFAPRYVGPRSMKIYTTFNSTHYDENTCGIEMARTSLISSRTASTANSTALSNVLTSIDNGAMGIEPSPAQIALSPACVDDTICAELKSEHSGAGCGDKLKDLGAAKSAYVGFKVCDICKAMCGCTCPAESS